MKELDEILEKCIERAAGTMVGNGIVRDHAHTAILSLMKSKQMSITEIGKEITEASKSASLLKDSIEQMGYIGYYTALHLAIAIHKEQLKRLEGE